MYECNKVSLIIIILFLQGSFVEEDRDGFDLPLVVNPIIQSVEVKVAQKGPESALFEPVDVSPQLVNVHVHPFQISALLGHFSQVIRQFQLSLQKSMRRGKKGGKKCQLDRFDLLCNLLCWVITLCVHVYE